MCIVQGPGCTRVPVEAHHRLRRSQGGTDAHLIAACHACHHDLIHAQPRWAYNHGLLLHTWNPEHPLVLGCAPSCEIDHEEEREH